jgi:hypothetical protein
VADAFLRRRKLPYKPASGCECRLPHTQPELCSFDLVQRCGTVVGAEAGKLLESNDTGCQEKPLQLGRCSACLAACLTDDSHAHDVSHWVHKDLAIANLSGVR